MHQDYRSHNPRKCIIQKLLFLHVKIQYIINVLSVGVVIYKNTPEPQNAIDINVNASNKTKFWSQPHDTTITTMDTFPRHQKIM